MFPDLEFIKTVLNGLRSRIEKKADLVNGVVPSGQLPAETDPTVPAWAKVAQKPSYTASEVGADASGTAASHVAAHNTGTDTHNDIRLLIQGLTDRMNALADSDDTTLDQLSEIVTYIKSNRDLISAITTDKVGVADIIDNLTTNVTNKPLSAAQGVALKALIESLSEEIENIPGGQDGVTPTIGDNGNWYLGDTDTGKPSRGEAGPPGADGYTPQRGTDYWTAADQQAIVDQALAALPAWEGGSY